MGRNQDSEEGKRGAGGIQELFIHAMQRWTPDYSAGSSAATVYSVLSGETDINQSPSCMYFRKCLEWWKSPPGLNSSVHKT